MKRSRFTEEQIIGVLKEAEAGKKPDDLCREHGIAKWTFYQWRKKFGGLEVSDAKRLRDEFLNQHLFYDVNDARNKATLWKEDYNKNRPHSSLNYATPYEFAQRFKNNACQQPLICEVMIGK